MASEDRGLVVITGANGTIGYASVLHALRTGYRVRCIVRRDEAIAHIKRGPSLQQFLNKIEYAIVSDNTVPGAYDDALKGARYAVHIAGVWPTPNYHPDNEIWHPFVKSMENILSAADKSGSVKRVVFTQAGAGLVDPDKGDTLGTRMDQVLDEYVKIDAHSAAFRPPIKSPHHAYCGAKAYCMQYLQERKGQFPFSIVQIIPGTVIGPSELVSTAADAKAQMNRMSKGILFNDMKPRYAFGFVHVDDCAAIHIEALDESKAPNDSVPNWFVAAATTENKPLEEIWKGAGNVIEEEFGKEIEKGIFKIGKENMPINVPFRVDSALTERTLLDGTKMRGINECVRSVAQWYVGLV